MITIAFFNNRGGVGTTTLVYHVASMFAELGLKVVAADFDPQANLTSMSLPERELARIEDDEIDTIFDVIEPLIGDGTAITPGLVSVRDNFALLPGDLDLSKTEDSLSREWTESASDSSVAKKRAFKVTAGLADAIRESAEAFGATVALVDVGPNLGAINRCALLAADYVVVPVAPDLFSLKGLTNVGRGLSDWKKSWNKRLEDAPGDRPWPNGQMKPLGYVVSRFSTYAGERATHFRRWINQVPVVFHRDVVGDTTPFGGAIEDDPMRLAWLKDYRSLVPMAHAARKPIFALKPADGAIGGHQQAVTQAYEDFAALVRTIHERAGMKLPFPF